MRQGVLVTQEAAPSSRACGGTDQGRQPRRSRGAVANVAVLSNGFGGGVAWSKGSVDGVTVAGEWIFCRAGRYLDYLAVKIAVETC